MKNNIEIDKEIIILAERISKLGKRDQKALKCLLYYFETVNKKEKNVKKQEAEYE
jgi:hypothetical protein